MTNPRPRKVRMFAVVDRYGYPFCVSPQANIARREAADYVPSHLYDDKKAAWRWALSKGWRIRPVTVIVE